MSNLLSIFLGLWKRQEYRYLLIGIWNTGFSYGAFVVVEVLFGSDLSSIEVLCVASTLGIIQSYGSQRKFVWRSCSPVVGEFMRFFPVVFAQFLLNLLLLHVFVDKMHTPMLATQFVITGVLVAGTFLVLRAWTFSGASATLRQDKVEQEIRYSAEDRNDQS